jgi:hypothetical protein
MDKANPFPNVRSQNQQRDDYEENKRPPRAPVAIRSKFLFQLRDFVFQMNEIAEGVLDGNPGVLCVLIRFYEALIECSQFLKELKEWNGANVLRCPFERGQEERIDFRVVYGGLVRLDLINASPCPSQEVARIFEFCHHSWHEVHQKRIHSNHLEVPPWTPQRETISLTS